MAKNRGKKSFSRKENSREENKTTQEKELMTFSLKFLDESQPKHNPQNIQSWAEGGLLPSLVNRLKDISNLTRDEATNQQQLKTVKFPPDDKTKFVCPKNVNINVCWAELENLGGKPRAIGYIQENTFYIVFLDKDHEFWESKLKHT